MMAKIANFRNFYQKTDLRQNCVFRQWNERNDEKLKQVNFFMENFQEYHGNIKGNTGNEDSDSN
jgi:hypothetical protein